MKYYWSLAFIFIQYFAAGQSSIPVIQQSPNVSELLRYVDIPVNKYTGVPDITIPIYEVVSGNLKLPISLSYHAGGIKVTQEASQVGLGWVLNGGGVISREVRGGDDLAPRGYYNNNLMEFSGNNTYQEIESKLGRRGDNVSYYKPLSSSSNWLYDILSYENVNFIDFIYNSGNLALDYEPDVFSYSFGGITGRFILTKNYGVLLQDPSQGLKIAFNSTTRGFTVISDRGDTYEFFEREGTSTGLEFLTSYTSAWHLTKIISADNSVLDLTYDTMHVFNEQFNARTQTFVGIAGKNLQGDDACPVGGEFTTPPPLAPSIVQLKEITFPLGKIKFNYNDREDMPYDKKLTEIIIENSWNPEDNVSYILEQDYFSSGLSGYDGKRLRLKSLTKRNTEGSVDQAHTFVYNTQHAPPKNSKGIDWWGYNNGMSNTTLLPHLAFYHYDHTFKETPNTYADRLPNEAYAQVFMLTKITYPTGGYTTFSYEMNDYDSGNSTNEYNSTVLRNFRKVENIMQARIGDPVLETDLLVVNASGNVDINLRSFEGILDLSINPPIYGIGSAGECYIEIRNKVSNTLVGQMLLGNSGSWNHTGGGRCHTSGSFNLPEGAYKVRFFASASSQFLKYFELKLSYYTNDANPWHHPILKGPGLRISMISTFDPVTSKSLTKKFIYNYSEDRDNDGVDEHYSHGRLLVPNSFITPSFKTSIYNQFMTNICLQWDLNSYNLYQTINHVMGYDQVTVLTDENGGAGKTEYFFHNTPNRIFGYQFEQIDFRERGHADFTDLKNGILYKQIDYRKVGTNLYAKVKEQKFNYSDVLHNTALGIKKHRNPYRTGLENIVSDAVFWVLTYYPAMQSVWVRLDSTEVTDYEDGGQLINFRTTYTYAPTTYSGLPVHFFPSKIRTTSSKGHTLEENFTYPQNYPDTAVYNSMIARNQLNYVVESTKFSSDKQTYQIINRYGSFNDNTLSKPVRTVEFGASHAIKKIVYYNRYDNKGNLLEYRNGYEIPVALVYGYNQSYIVAKVTGASYQDILTALGKTDPNLTYLQQYNTTQLSIELDKLRTYIRLYVPNAKMESYTYKPSVGMTSMTDMRGITEYYEYDGFQRLKNVVDFEGNILRSHQYNYKKP